MSYENPTDDELDNTAKALAGLGKFSASILPGLLRQAAKFAKKIHPEGTESQLNAAAHKLACLVTLANGIMLMRNPNGKIDREETDEMIEMAKRLVLEIQKGNEEDSLLDKLKQARQAMKAKEKEEDWFSDDELNRMFQGEDN